MKCPHCNEGIHEGWNALQRANDNSQVLNSAGERSVRVSLASMVCPECDKVLVRVTRVESEGDESVVTTRFAYPGNAAARSADPAVKGDLRTDYAEAAAVLSLSPQASAALSRRIVQHVLSDRDGYEKRNLSDQIGDFIDDAGNPSHLKENLDYLREIGNFASHPMKSTNTGEVLPVEPGEAEWALDVVDGLFDFYIVGPARDAERRAKFDDKIKKAGRHPIGEGDHE